MRSILLVEDEPEIGAVVRQGLEKANYQVTWVQDGAAGLGMAQDTSFALIVLDLMLPGRSGWEVCRTLRARRDTTPILMLTAREAVEDRVRGLEMGADDYLPKPFAFPELLARVGALLRRDSIHKTRTICIADLKVDTGRRGVTRAGQEVALTRREYELLEALAAREGRILTRDWVLECVWTDDESYSNTVDVHIAALRRKIDAGHPTRLIHTVRGVGYTLRALPLSATENDEGIP